MALVTNVRLTDVVRIICPVCNCPMNVSVLVDLTPKPAADATGTPIEQVGQITFDIKPKTVAIDHTCEVVQPSIIPTAATPSATL